MRQVNRELRIESSGQGRPRWTERLAILLLFPLLTAPRSLFAQPALAQAATDVPWPVTSKWLFGAVGALSVVWLIFAVAIQVRKLFVRQPPNESLELNHKALVNRVSITEGAITGIRAELQHDRENAEQVARTRSAGIYNAINKVREDLTSKMDAERNEVLSKIQAVDDSVTQYAKDTERALGRIEGKLDK